MEELESEEGMVGGVKESEKDMFRGDRVDGFLQPIPQAQWCVAK